MAANTSKRLSRIRGLSFTQSFSFSDDRELRKAAKMAAPSSRAEKGFRFRTRSVSPPRTKVYDWEEFSRIDEVDEDNLDENGGAATIKPRRWSLKEFLYRSISEGRGRAREKEMERERLVQAEKKKQQPSYRKLVNYNSKKFGGRSAAMSKKLSGAAISKQSAAPPRSTAQIAAPPRSTAQKRDAVSAHERYYSANRARAQAQAAELKKKTFLPYKQGFLGWLGPFQNSNSNNRHVVLPVS